MPVTHYSHVINSKHFKATTFTVQGASYVVKGRIVKFVGRVHFQVMQRSAISIAMMMLWNKMTRASCVLMGPVSRIAIEACKILLAGFYGYAEYWR